MEDNPTQDAVPVAPQEPQAQTEVAPESATSPPSVAQQAQGAQQEPGQRYEEQIKRLRGQVSAYDRTAKGYASQLKDQQRHYENALKQAQTADMSEHEKAQYEAAFYKQKYGEVQQQVQATQYQMAYSDAMNQWNDYYNGMGVPKDRLDQTSIETMQHSAFEFMRDKLGGEDGQVEPGQQSTQQNDRIPPPHVATSTPQGTNPGTPRFADIPLNEWEDYYKRVERGTLDPDQLPR